ncbi:zinc-binding dehydrogenase [Arthrobacter sp. ISL-30]|uniref:zinc-binding dehydrogenase n=1 Tax=Arthrobacter sp. ISL-30 TaxID=2819109 RepID=UPI002035941D|nr:zinc-binding dehydrogenase [Arthrobacter sp. ISL-30]
MLKLRGATVTTTTLTPEKADLSRKAGADDVLEYAHVPEHVRELIGGRGVVVYDGVCRDTFEGSLDR